MASLNKVFLIGNLTRTPELRYTPSGTAVADLRLAVNRNYTTQGGEKREETCFLTVVVWGKQAESCGEYLDKGSPIMVEGRLQTRDWETKDGQKRNVVEVVAERVQFMGRSKVRRGRRTRKRARGRSRRAPARPTTRCRSSVSPVQSYGPVPTRGGTSHSARWKPVKRRRFGRRKVCKFCVDQVEPHRLQGRSPAPQTSSRSAARSPRGASRGAAPAISGSSPAPSVARARWPCSPRPPSDERAMKIILMDDVPTLGRRGEVRDVSDGYARNYLLPQKLALHATPANLKNIEQHQGAPGAPGGQAPARTRRARPRRIEALHFAQRRQASDEGRLFGSVGRADLASFLAPARHRDRAASHRARRADQDARRVQRADPPASRRHRPAEGVRRPGSSGGDACTDLLTSKIPPHSLEAERAVLGAILLERESLPKAVELLEPADFYKEGPPQDLRRDARALRAQRAGGPAHGVGGAAAARRAGRGRGRRRPRRPGRGGRDRGPSARPTAASSARRPSCATSSASPPRSSGRATRPATTSTSCSTTPSG